MLIKSTYKKTETFVSKVRHDSNYRRSTMGHSNGRRFTFSTNLDNNPIDEDDEEKCVQALPKLHVAEIKSLRTPEQLADVLDPVYETVATVTGGDGSDETEGDADSGFIHLPDSKGEDYYAFPNASTASVDCQDWIRCISSADSSVYNNSLNEDELRYLERKFVNKRKPENSSCKTSDENVKLHIRDEYDNVEKSDKPAQCLGNKQLQKVYYDNKLAEDETDLPRVLGAIDEDPEVMINEIMQIIEKKDNREIVLDPNFLSPNRRDGDNITFVECD